MLYEEVPKINPDTTGETAAPPIPPTRSLSLTTNNTASAAVHQTNKKLPTIPNSTSVNDLDLVNRINHTNQNHYTNVDRPLPPLPTPSLDIINEPGTTTDEDPLDDDDDDDDKVADEANNASSAADSDSDNEIIDEEELSEAEETDESNDDNMIDEIIASNKRNPLTVYVTPPAVRLTNGSGGHGESFDADGTLPPSPTERTQQQQLKNGIGGSSIGNNDR